MKKIAIIILILCSTCWGKILRSKSQGFDPFEETGGRIIASSFDQAEVALSIGTAEGQMLYWNDTTKMWTASDVTKLKWTAASDTLLADTITTGLITGADVDITGGTGTWSTSGTLASGTHTIGDLVIGDGTIADSTGIAFSATNFTGVGAIGSGAITSSGASTFNSGSVDADFTVNWNTGVGLFVEGSSGNVGIGTTTIPHGGVGGAKFAIEGATGSVTGPHLQFTTTSDNYPLMQILNWRHDDISIRFDSYWDGANKSSDAGSNYAIFKVNDLFKIMYDSGVAKGATLGWNNGIVLNTSGLVTIPNGGLHVGGDSDAGDNNLLVDGTIGSGVHTITHNNGIMLVFDNTNDAGTVAAIGQVNGGSIRLKTTDATQDILLNAGGNILVVGTTNLLWNTGGSSDIGAVSTGRPDNIFAKTSLQIANALNEIGSISVGSGGSSGGGGGPGRGVFD